MALTREVIRERSVSSPEVEKATSVWSLNRLIYYIVGVIEVLLVFRFTLKILGANPVSPFVSFIYTLSGIFVAPFRGIFRSAVAEGLETTSVLEASTVFAILVYLVIAVGIVELVKIITATESD